MTVQKNSKKFLRPAAVKNLKRAKETFGNDFEEKFAPTSILDQQEPSAKTGSKVSFAIKKPEKTVKKASKTVSAKKTQKEKKLNMMSKIDALYNSSEKQEDYSQIKSDALDSLKENIYDLVKTPKGSRNIQYFLKNSDEKVKNQIFDLLKDNLLDMMRDKYSVHIVEKFVMYCQGERRQFTIDAIIKNVIDVVTRKNASKMIEKCFNNHFGSKEKKHLIYRFFGPVFIHEYLSGTPVEKILADPNKKKLVLESCQKHSHRVIKEGVINVGFIHNFLLRYISMSEESGMKEHTGLYKLLNPYFAQLCSSHHGATIAIKLLENMDQKDHKIALRQLGDDFKQACSDPNAYIVVCAALNIVNLEGLLRNRLIKPINENIDFFFTDKYAHRVLTFLACRGSSREMEADSVERLRAAGIHLKTDVNKELKNVLIVKAAKKIVRYIISNIDMLLDDIKMQNILLGIYPFIQKHRGLFLDTFMKSVNAQLNLAAFYDSSVTFRFMKLLMKADSEFEQPTNVEKCENDELSGEEGEEEASQNEEADEKIIVRSLVDRYVDELENIQLSNAFVSNRGCLFLIIVLENCSPENATLLKNILGKQKDEISKNNSHNAKSLLEMLN